MNCHGVRGFYIVFLQFLTIWHHIFGGSSISKGNCSNPLGLENGIIPDNKLTASSNSILSVDLMNYQKMEAKYGRLNGPFSWCTDHTTATWLMVELNNVTMVTAMATQGFRNSHNHYYVNKYQIKYSTNCHDWKYVSVDGKPKTFTGNKDGYNTVRNNFKPIKAKYIRIIPLAYKYRVCMRVELYGCKKVSKSNQTSTPSTTKSPGTPTALTVDPLPSLATTLTTQDLSHKNRSSHFSQATSKTTKLNNFLLAAIIFSAMAVVILIPVIIFLLLRKRRKEFRKVHHRSPDCLFLDDKMPCIESCENGNTVMS